MGSPSAVMKTSKFERRVAALKSPEGLCGVAGGGVCGTACEDVRGKVFAPNAPTSTSAKRRKVPFCLHVVALSNDVVCVGGRGSYHRGWLFGFSA
jgi:hypothetical protein